MASMAIPAAEELSAANTQGGTPADRLGRGSEFEELVLGLATASARLISGVDKLLQMHRASIDRFVRQLNCLDAVPGYEALLISHGSTPVEARLAGHVITRLGQRLVENRTAARSLAAALRDMVKADGASPLIAVRRARALRNEFASPGGQLALEKALSLTRPETRPELQQIMERAVARDPSACAALAKIAAALAAALPDPRGRPLDRTTAVHEVLLFWLEDEGHGRGYTWNAHKNDFSDRATLATRAASGDPDFDPRYALRDYRKRRLG